MSNPTYSILPSISSGSDSSDNDNFGSGAIDGDIRGRGAGALKRRQTDSMEDTSNSDDGEKLPKNGPIQNNLDEPHDFDSFLKMTVGEFGLYQQFIVWILCIPACFMSAYGTFDLIFITYTPKMYCKDPNVEPSRGTPAPNTTYPPFFVNSDQCSYILTNKSGPLAFNETFQCSKWSYDQEYFTETVITKWDLVCDRALEGRTIWSLLNLATIIAAFYSYVQDRYGRKKAFLLNLTVYLVGGISSTLFPRTPIEFGVLKFVAGITCIWEICFCWALEFVGASKRTLVTTIMSVVYGLANMSMALIAYLTENWVTFGLCTTVPFSLLFFIICLVPESPRWLLAENRIDKVIPIIQTMGRWQGRNLDPKNLHRMLKNLKQNLDREKSDDKVNRLSVADFFRSKNLLCKNLLLTFVIVVGNQLYSTIPYDSQNLYPDFYVAYLLQSAVELPATLLNLMLLNRIGRVLPLATFMLLSSACCLLEWPIEPYGPWPGMVLAAAARFFISAAVAIMEQLGEETYPTVGRGIGTSISYVASALAAFSIQYIVYSSELWRILPLIILGALTLVAGLAALFLPDTFGKPMPDTVQQAEAQGAVGFRAFKQNLSCIFRKKYGILMSNDESQRNV